MSSTLSENCPNYKLGEVVKYLKEKAKSSDEDSKKDWQTKCDALRSMWYADFHRVDHEDYEQRKQEREEIVKAIFNDKNSVFDGKEKLLMDFFISESMSLLSHCKELEEESRKRCVHLSYLFNKFAEAFYSVMKDKIKGSCHDGNFRFLSEGFEHEFNILYRR